MSFFQQCLPSLKQDLNQNEKPRIPISERLRSQISRNQPCSEKTSLKKKPYMNQNFPNNRVLPKCRTQKQCHYYPSHDIIDHQFHQPTYESFVTGVSQIAPHCQNDTRINFIYHSNLKENRNCTSFIIPEQPQKEADETHASFLSLLNHEEEEQKYFNSRMTNGTMFTNPSSGPNYIDNSHTKSLDDLTFRKVESSSVKGDEGSEISELEEQFDTSDFLSSVLRSQKQTNTQKVLKTK